jgi:hypothetical protein
MYLGILVHPPCSTYQTLAIEQKQYCSDSEDDSEALATSVGVMASSKVRNKLPLLHNALHDVTDGLTIATLQ